MKFAPVQPPRVYEVGRGEIVRIKDCARIGLAPDEQVTFTTEAGGEYDVTRKAWGFYATPSINARLPSFGLRAAMSRNPEGRYFIFLVEAGREPDFLRYLAVERNVLVSWLDNDADLARLEASAGTGMPESGSNAIACICGGSRFKSVQIFTSPPPGENVGRPPDPEYRREILRCDTCGHFVGVHNPLLPAPSAPPDADANVLDDPYPVGAPSDAADRADRILHFAERHFGTAAMRATALAILEVGSATAASSYLLNARGWDCTAVDSDPLAVRRATSAGLRAIHGNLMDMALQRSFDVIALTRQLADAQRPVAVLDCALRLLKPTGCIYAELPDGETAIREGGPSRPEFFIENEHIFSFASAALLGARAGLDLVKLDRVRQPSGRYAFCLFLIPRGGPAESV